MIHKLLQSGKYLIRYLKTEITEQNIPFKYRYLQVLKTKQLISNMEDNLRSHTTDESLHVKEHAKNPTPHTQFPRAVFNLDGIH